MSRRRAECYPAHHYSRVELTSNQFAAENRGFLMTLLVQPMTPPWPDPIAAGSVEMWPMRRGLSRDLSGTHGAPRLRQVSDE